MGAMKAIALFAVVLGSTACGGGGGDGGGELRCTEWPDDATFACMCRYQATYDAVNSDGSEVAEWGSEECNDAAFFPDTKCCASPGWGANADTECVCSMLRCGITIANWCECTYNPYSDIPDDRSSCTAAVGGVCCLSDAGFCTCRDDVSTCSGTDVAVAECSAATIEFCSNGYSPIDTCALPEDDGGGDGIPL